VRAVIENSMISIPMKVIANPISYTTIFPLFTICIWRHNPREAAKRDDIKMLLSLTARSILLTILLTHTATIPIPEYIKHTYINSENYRGKLAFILIASRTGNITTKAS
jgi:hypothetical protein